MYPTQGWVPLFMEYEVHYRSSEKIRKEWVLNELDFELKDPDAFDDSADAWDPDKNDNVKVLRGRSFLNATGAKALADRVGTVLEEHAGKRLPKADKEQVRTALSSNTLMQLALPAGASRKTVGQCGYAIRQHRRPERLYPGRDG